MRARASGCFLIPPGWEHVRPRPVPAGSEPPAQGGALSQDLENAPGAISIKSFSSSTNPGLRQGGKAQTRRASCPGPTQPTHLRGQEGTPPRECVILGTSFLDAARLKAADSSLDRPRGAAGDRLHLPHRFRLNPAPASSRGPSPWRPASSLLAGLAHRGRSALVGSPGKQGLETWRRLVCDAGPELGFHVPTALPRREMGLLGLVGPGRIPTGPLPGVPRPF